jgi:hypothetical protein
MEQLEYEQIIEKWKIDNKELIDSDKCKKIFLECLITNKAGSKIDWKKNNNVVVYFIYENVEGYIRIINYNKTNEKLLIEYNDKQFEINTTGFTRCALGNLLKKYTSDFKIEVGTHFKDDKRDIIITDREYRKDSEGKTWKWYKYTCNVCRWTEGWMPESSVLNKIGCSCCNGKVVVENINSIYHSDKWMVPYIGEEVAKTHTRRSGDKVKVTCPDCGRIKSKVMSIDDIYKRKNIACSCSDNNPFTEKYIFNILEQLNINFEYHKTFDWSKDVQVDNLELCGRKEYDFYFKYNDEDYVLEANGIQHYEESNRGRSLEYEQENDRIKKELAISNGIKPENYIIIDCRESTLEWIRDNDNGLLNSRLNYLFDLSSINWLKAEEFALSNRVKEACELWNSNSDLTTTQIGEIMKLDRQIIRKYLLKGLEHNWCNYDPKLESEKIINEFINSNLVSIVCVEKKLIFESIKQCADKSIEIFGVKLSDASLSRVCKYQNKYKGYNFKYVNELTSEELKEYSKAI